MKLSIIIVVYNSFDLVKNCLASLYQDLPQKTEIILIDNASPEKGIEKIIQKFPYVIYIKNTTNMGFAKGVNTGIRKSKGEYLLILNPDTILLPGTLQYMIDSLSKKKEIQLAGCKILNQQKELQQSAGYAYPNLLSHLYEYNHVFYRLVSALFPNYHPVWYSLSEHKQKMNVKHIIGAFLFLRKSIINHIGYFDEQFFMYREETDFCQRLNQKGYTISYLREFGGAIHIGGGSSHIKLTQASSYYMDSTYKYFKKYHSVIYIAVAYIIGLFSAYMSYGAIWIKGGTNEKLNPWTQIINWHLKNIQKFL